MDKLFSSDSDDLCFYSEYSGIPGVDRIELVEKIVAPWLASLNEDSDCSIQVGRGLVLFSQLQWDSEYFGLPIYKLHGTFGPDCRAALNQLIQELELRHGRFYIYVDVASEHTETLQVVSSRGFRFVEPRVTFVRDQLSSFDQPRYPVRRAQLEDIPLLREVAEHCVNRFDRLHADAYFSEDTANGYLATYVENSVRGFADVVLVPDAARVPAKAFLTGRYSLDQCSKIHLQVARLVLGAVHPECAGWFRKLSSEMTYDMRDVGAEAILMTTQTANRAAIRAMENLGYRIGSVTHVLAYSRP